MVELVIGCVCSLTLMVDVISSGKSSVHLELRHGTYSKCLNGVEILDCVNEWSVCWSLDGCLKGSGEEGHGVGESFLKVGKEIVRVWRFGYVKLKDKK